MNIEEITRLVGIPTTTIYRWKKYQDESSDYGDWRSRILHLLYRLTPAQYFDIIGYKVKCSIFEDEIIFTNCLHLSGSYFISSNNTNQEIELLRIDNTRLVNFIDILKKEYIKQFDEIDMTIKFDEIVIKTHRNIFTDILFTFNQDWLQKLQKEKGLI